MALAEQVMTTEPYASARRLFWIVDNGSSHRGKKAIDRLTKKLPNAVMVHTPVHGSEHSKTDTTPRHSRSSGGSPPPTWTICRPGSTDTHSPTDKKNPPSPWQPDQPPKDFESRPLRQPQHHQEPHMFNKYVPSYPNQTARITDRH